MINSAAFVLVSCLFCIVWSLGPPWKWDGTSQRVYPDLRTFFQKKKKKQELKRSSFVVWKRELGITENITPCMVWYVHGKLWIFSQRNFKWQMAWAYGVCGASKQNSKIILILEKSMQMSTKGLVYIHFHMCVCVHHILSTHIHTRRRVWKSVKIDSVQLSEGGVSSAQQSRIKVLLPNNSWVKPWWKSSKKNNQLTQWM